MNPLLIAGALVAVILLGLLWWRTRQPAPLPAASTPRNAGKQAFVDTVTGWAPMVTRVLTRSEIKAYDTLREAFPAHIILAQVPLARFMKVPTRNSYAEWLRRVGHLCADLVVCDRHSQVVAVVELRFAAEVPNERAVRRQKRLERVLKAADVPIHVWTDDAIPSASDARQAILPEAVDSDIEAGYEMPAFPATGDKLTTAVVGTPVRRQRQDEEGSEMSDARPETWFDEFDTTPAALTPEAGDERNPR